MLSKVHFIYINVDFDEPVENQSAGLLLFVSGGKEEQEKIDLVITLGGDGTMLRSVSLFQHSHHIPVFLSFRFGTLGFLTPHVWCPDSFQTFIDKAFSGTLILMISSSYCCNHKSFYQIFL